MTEIWTLYTGSITDDTCADQLRQWSAAQRSVELICKSIHSDPAAAMRLGITDLPALVRQNVVLVQGYCPTSEFLDTLLTKESQR